MQNTQHGLYRYSLMLLLIAIQIAGCNKKQSGNQFVNGQIATVKLHYEITKMILRADKTQLTSKTRSIQMLSDGFEDNAFRISLIAAIHAASDGCYDSAEKHVYKSLSINRNDAKALALLIVLDLRHGGKHADVMKEYIAESPAEMLNMNTGTRLLMHVVAGDSIDDDETTELIEEVKWFIYFIRDLRIRICNEISEHKDENTN